MMEDLPYAMKLVLSAAFKTFNEKPFLRRSVGELMWGYEDPLVDFLNNFFPGMIPFKGKFGLFADVSTVARLRFCDVATSDQLSDSTENCCVVMEGTESCGCVKEAAFTKSAALSCLFLYH